MFPESHAHLNSQVNHAVMKWCDIKIMPDNMAVYRGTTSRGFPYVVLFKHTNAGKRHSHQGSYIRDAMHNI